MVQVKGSASQVTGSSGGPWIKTDMTRASFVGSCSGLGRVQATRWGGFRTSRPRQRLFHSPIDIVSLRKVERPPIALKKRRKQYFFKLLSAARHRDKRLLASVVKSLGKDVEYLRMRSEARVADPFNVEDVLLKAASRCGEAALAERVFTVRYLLVGRELMIRTCT